MSRSKWKGPFINWGNLNEIKVSKDQKHLKKKSVISRDSNVVPSFVGLTFDVYNGKNYDEITVNEQMVGHKMGEFSFTRAKYVFKKKKKLKKKKK